MWLPVTCDIWRGLCKLLRNCCECLLLVTCFFSESDSFWTLSWPQFLFLTHEFGTHRFFPSFRSQLCDRRKTDKSRGLCGPLKTAPQAFLPIIWLLFCSKKCFCTVFRLQFSLQVHNFGIHGLSPLCCLRSCDFGNNRRNAMGSASPGNLPRWHFASNLITFFCSKWCFQTSLLATVFDLLAQFCMCVSSSKESYWMLRATLGELIVRVQWGVCQYFYH